MRNKIPSPALEYVWNHITLLLFFFILCFFTQIYKNLLLIETSLITFELTYSKFFQFFGSLISRVFLQVNCQESSPESFYYQNSQKNISRYQYPTLTPNLLNKNTWSMEKAMATHSSTLAWEIPWTEEPGGLQSMGSQKVGHDLATKQQQQYVCVYNWGTLLYGRN